MESGSYITFKFSLRLKISNPSKNTTPKIVTRKRAQQQLQLYKNVLTQHNINYQGYCQAIIISFLRHHNWQICSLQPIQCCCSKLCWPISEPREFCEFSVSCAENGTPRYTKWRYLKRFLIIRCSQSDTIESLQVLQIRNISADTVKNNVNNINNGNPWL
jgi:hypothetical protein